MLEKIAPLASHTEPFSVTQPMAEAGEAVDQPATLQLLTTATDPSPADPSSANPNSEVPHDGPGATTGALIVVPAKGAETAQPLSNPAQGSHQSAHSDAAENDISSDGSGSPAADKEDPFLTMYESNWTEHDCIFSAQRAAAHLEQAVKKIQTPDTLTHLKASVIPVSYTHLTLPTNREV